MSKEKSSPPVDKEGVPERAARIYRNWNALGTVAMGGLAVIAPVGNVIWAGLAGVNAVQTGIGEVARRTAKRARTKNKNAK